MLRSPSTSLTSELGSGGFTCNKIGDFGWYAGGTGTKQDPTAVKGQKLAIKVAVAEDVPWSLSVDLAHDTATFDELTGSDS